MLHGLANEAKQQQMAGKFNVHCRKSCRKTWQITQTSHFHKSLQTLWRKICFKWQFNTKRVVFAATRMCMTEQSCEGLKSILPCYKGLQWRINDSVQFCQLFCVLPHVICFLLLLLLSLGYVQVAYQPRHRSPQRSDRRKTKKPNRLGSNSRQTEQHLEQRTSSTRKSM